MPAHYDQPGLAFQYPENWRLDEGKSDLGEDTASVESPGGAFWTVARLPHTDAGRLAAAALEAIKAEYQDVETEDMSEFLLGYRLEGFDVAFVYLDLTSTARIRSVQTPHGAYLIHYQAEDREMQVTEPVFRAITVSLLQGLPSR